MAILAVCLAFSLPAGAQDLTGRQIMDEVSARHDRPYEFEIQQMTLRDKGGNEEEREVKRYARELEQGENRYLMVFHNPAGVRGVALLTWQHDTKDDDQWIYLPAQGKKAKRIAKGGRQNYFMGTDYTFEDLISESRDKFRYERLDDEELDGVAVFVVDAFPEDAGVKKETGYKYRRSWIRQDIFFIVRTEYFDKRGRYIKNQIATDLVNIEGDMWRAQRTFMDNEKRGHSTEIEIIDRTFEDSDVPKKMFHTRYITSGKHLR